MSSGDAQPPGDDACFVACVLPPSQFREAGSERPGPNDFTDAEVRSLDLTGLPVNWEHEDDKTLGIVEQNYTTDSGAKYVVVRMATNNPFGATALRQMKAGEMNEMSLTHKFRWGQRPDGNLVEHRIPISIGVTKKGNREGCHIHPNSIWTEAPVDRFRETLYSRTYNNSKAATQRTAMADTSMADAAATTPDANQTPVATPATPATPAAAPVATPAAAAPAHSDRTAASVAEQDNVLAELSDPAKVQAYNLKPEEYVALTSLAAQRGSKLEQTLSEREAKLAAQQKELEQIKAELTAAKQRDQDATKLARDMYDKKVAAYFNDMKSAGFPLPENTMNLFTQARSDDPAKMLELNQMSEAIFANGAKMAQHIVALEQRFEAEQAFAAKQKEAQQSALTGLTARFNAANNALGPVATPASSAGEAHPEDNRGGKRARPDSEGADSAHGTTTEAQAPVSAQTQTMLQQLPDFLLAQLPAHVRRQA